MCWNTWLRGAALQLALIIIVTSAHTEYVGNLHGDLFIEQGQAEYMIPIQLPHGPNNIQPNLHLVYNSGGGNGPMGLGWRFDVLSAVSRCPHTIAQDGQVRGIRYDAKDRFCLDGQRLVVVNGTYGADKSEYRTEVDTYTKTVASGQHGSGPAFFRVWTKDGSILDYGTSQQIIGGGQDSVHQWNLQQIQDRAGNKLTLTYISNSFSPSELHYGTTSVIFTYQTRPDNITSYFNGGIFSNVMKRLAAIEIRNPKLIRQYKLHYHVNGTGASNQSLLTSMQLCGETDNCLRPLNFKYGTSDQLVETMPLPNNTNKDFGSGWSSHLEHPRYVIDVNADGLADVVGFHSSCVKVALNDGNGSFHPAQCWVNGFGSSTGWTGSKHPRYVGDIDGDGLPDLVGFFNDGVHVSFNTGTSFLSPEKLISSFGYAAGGSWRNEYHLRMVQDVNGDGRDDIVGFYTGKVDVALSKGRTFEPVSTWSTEFGYSTWRVGTNPRFLKDVNGDKLPDIVGFGNTNVEVAINTGSSFAKSVVWISDYTSGKGWSTEHPRLMEDMNGDGLADIVGFGKNGVCISLSTGTSFTPSSQQLSEFGYYTSPAYRVANHERLVADMTGDGLPDLVGFYSDGVHVSYNRGNGTFSSPALWVSEFGYNSGWRMTSYPRYLLDTNGDGISDIVGFKNDGVYISLNKNSHPKIHKVVDSFNNTQSISYMSLPTALKFGHYEKSYDVKYPNLSPVPSFQIVTKLTENEDSEAENTTSYIFSNFRFDASGRGSQGFNWKKEVDHRNRRLLTEYEQAFPFTGKTKMIQQNVSSETGHDITISETLTTYEATTHLSVHDIMPTREIVTSYELNGNQVSEIETTYTGSNSYGDALHTTSRTTGGGQTFIKRTINIYRDLSDMWLVGQLMSSKVAQESPCIDPITRHAIYEYDATTGYVTSQTVEPDHELSLKTDFKYDHFGNVITRTETPVQDIGKSRQIITTFDNNGILMLSSSNGIGHTEKYYYDESRNLETQTGANGLNTTWTYDALGRKVSEHQADGTQITWSYNWDQTTVGAIYNIQIKSDGSPTKTRVFDVLDRVIREKSVGFDNSDIVEDITYNKEGLVYKHSYPHFTSSHAVWKVFHYDDLGRTIRQETPGAGGISAEQHISYNGQQSTNINALGHSTHLEKDVLGQLIKVTDHLGGIVQYKYDAIGNMIQMTDTDGYVTSTEYNLLGHKTQSNDPNMGLWKYQHNAFGELIWQKDAKQNVLTQQYDKLGRLVKRNELEGTTKWIYDTRPNGLGKLGKVQGPDGYSKSWYFNEHGKETKMITSFQGQEYKLSTEYDSYGRISKQQYPNGQSLYKLYTNNGYLQEVGLGESNISPSSKSVWKALAYDALGRMKREHYGNDLVTDYEYDSAAHMVGITTHKDGANTVRHLDYIYDLNENLLSRRDITQEVSESFAYDELDRLVQSTVVSDDDRYHRRQNWDYYANGNIRFNDAYGLDHFQYHESKPHAVVKAGNHTYSYDANGNAVTKDGQAIHWTSYNKPSRFDAGTGHTFFKYGPDRRRYAKLSANGDSTAYLGKAYEIHTENNVSTTKMFVYGAMGRLVAIVSKNMTANSTNSVSYIHTDNLGSVDTISHDNSEVVERLSYDAFGMRRGDDWMNGDSKSDYSVRGYTGHEHIPELGLIHMNGRVYDPQVGRFLSPDPHVQDPANTQSLNRYSYALNNPLKHNDPTGFFWRRLLRVVVGVVASAVTAMILGPVVVAAVASVGLTGAAAVVASGAIVGAASGFVGGLIRTGTIRGALKGAVRGAVFRGVRGGIGQFGNTWGPQRVATQATAGGAISELAGGKFKDGFAMDGLAASARYLYNSEIEYDVYRSADGPGSGKTANQRPVAGANNIGMQGKPPDSSWIDDDMFLGINWGEGGGVSRALNRMPGVNAVSGLHDMFQVEMDNVLFPGGRDWFNDPGMLPDTLISNTALLDGPGMPAFLMDETRKDKR